MGDIHAPAMAGRRSLLLGMAGLASVALSGCMATAGAAQEEVLPTPAASILVDPAAPAPSRTAPAEAPEVEPHRPTPPTKQQIMAEFGARTPREWGLQVTGTVGRSAARDIALTLDACGGPGGTGCDQQLLTTLRKLNVPATLFLNERWIQANPALTAELARDPLFELANHGFLHRPLSVTGKSAYGIAGTSDVGQVYDEVMGNQAALQDITGHVPGFFRPGTAYYDDVAAAITRRLGVLPVNFTINGDGGATFAPATVAAEVGKARNGDIVIAHFNKPGSGTAAGLAQALPRLLDQGATFAKLGRVLPL
ncbi:polysaccharide deacetylase family protein [Pseudarthrobacter sulfonivorans]|uniref:polysaccharide deacetylase family protein n=1 Tax=Pseudarthrobacter sulfonivorans TaxID=121292 RepID=UPI00295E6646|nr:polysaccharide deacetylase family protein [Pseudarthrobacter sulfonivorans]